MFLIRLKKRPLIPCLSSFLNKISLGTVSNSTSLSSKNHESLIKISNKLKFGQDIPNGVRYHKQKPHESDTGNVRNVAKIQNGGHHNRQNFQFRLFWLGNSSFGR